MILNGKKIAQAILDELKPEVSSLPFKPVLADVVVGEDPVTESYVSIKSKRATEIGLSFEKIGLPADISQEDLLSQLKLLQKRENLAGILIQLPLPVQIKKDEIIEAINPELDVDGLTPENLGLALLGKPRYAPATAAAIMHIIDQCNLDMRGLPVLLVGSGELVGKPVSFMLINREATVTVANKSTINLSELARNSKLIICGAGVPNLIKPEMVSEGAVIIDAGTAESEGNISGDADFEGLKNKTLFITPVPGGVGPVTVAMLLKNTVISAKNLAKKKIS